MSRIGISGVPRLQLHGSEASPRRETETMNETLFNVLPDHLLDIILAQLPFQNLFRICTVCKIWNSRIRSRSLPDENAGAPCRAPWFFFFSRSMYQSLDPWDFCDYQTVLTKSQLRGAWERNHVSIYDSVLNKWHSLLLCPPINRGTSFVTGTSLAADAGLVCYFSYDNISESIVVSNPVTKSCRRLPSLPNKPRTMTMLTMVVDRVHNTYKVIVAGHYKGKIQNKADVFDSRTKSWTSTGRIPGNGNLDHVVGGKTVYFGKPVFSHGFLYVWNSARRNLVLLMCDLNQGVWSKIRAPLPVPTWFGELLEWQGQILIIGMTGNRSSNPPLNVLQFHPYGICIWELQASSLTWKEVDQMPAELFHICFEKDKLSLVSCQARQFVFLFFYNRVDYCLLVVYDLSTRAWRKPHNIQQGDVIRKWSLVECIFHEPRLDIMP